MQRFCHRHIRQTWKQRSCCALISRGALGAHNQHGKTGKTIACLHLTHFSLWDGCVLRFWLFFPVQKKTLRADPKTWTHFFSSRQITCVREGKSRPFLLCARVLSKTRILSSFRRATSARGACVFILVFSNCDATLLSRAHTPNVKAKKLLRVNF